ncbi:hypothetical protein GCM10027062_37240 [Nocardioides hungaricus]
MDDTWHRLERELVGEIESLGEMESLVAEEEPPEPGPARGLLRRRAAPPPVRYVQFLRHDGALFAECVGSRDHFGGDWPVTDEQHASLRALGWRAPGDDDPTGTQPAYPNYWWTDPSGAEVAAAGRLGAAALRVLGADPAALQHRTNRR